MAKRPVEHPPIIVPQIAADTPERIVSRKIKVLKTLSQLLLVGSLYITAQLVVALFLFAFDVKDESTLYKNPLLLVSAYGAAMGIIMLLLWFTMKARRISFADIGFKRPKIDDVFIALSGYGVYFLAILALFALITLMFPGIDLNQQQSIGFNRAASPAVLPFIFIALAILPPIVEETIFRGYLYSRLKLIPLSKPLSAVLVSVLFGIVHGQVNVAIDTFVLSIVMVYAMELRGGSIWPAVIMHFLKNSFAFVMIFIFKVG